MDQLVLARPYCSVSDKSVHGASHIPFMVYEEIIKNIPVTYQDVKQPVYEDDFPESVPQNEGHSMIYDNLMDSVKNSEEDYRSYSRSKRMADYEQDNEKFFDNQDYLTRRVELQLNEIMVGIESLIHMEGWSEKTFGNYKLLYNIAVSEKMSKQENLIKRVNLLTQLRLKAMLTLPREEYYKEPETYEPAVSSSVRTEMY